MTDEVKPYTDEDLSNLRRSVNDVRNHPPTPRVVRRLLATLDERTRERDEARRRLVVLLSVPPPDDLPLWDEGGWDVVRCVETIINKMAAVVLAKPVDPEAASLREEVARLRDSERKAWESCRETCVNLAAAERRAEEAEGRLREASRLAVDLNGALLSLSALAVLVDGDEKRCWCGDCDDDYDNSQCVVARHLLHEVEERFSELVFEIGERRRARAVS